MSKVTEITSAINHWIRQHRILALILTAIIVFACVTLIFHIKNSHQPKTANGLPTGPVTNQDIKSYPESKLVYPGAKVVQWVGSGESNDQFAGKQAAFYGAILSSQDSPEKIYAWYANWMKVHGWTPYTIAIASTQISDKGYERGSRESFIIAIDNPSKLEQTLGHSLPSAKTIFEYSYIIAPYSK